METDPNGLIRPVTDFGSTRKYGRRSSDVVVRLHVHNLGKLSERHIESAGPTDAHLPNGSRRATRFDRYATRFSGSAGDEGSFWLR
jgi:hypothetical protein